jgi:hypothetical protein
MGVYKRQSSTVWGWPVTSVLSSATDILSRKKRKQGFPHWAQQGNKPAVWTQLKLAKQIHWWCWRWQPTYREVQKWHMKQGKMIPTPDYIQWRRNTIRRLQEDNTHIIIHCRRHTLCPRPPCMLRPLASWACTTHEHKMILPGMFCAGIRGVLWNLKKTGV